MFFPFSFLTPLPPSFFAFIKDKINKTLFEFSILKTKQNSSFLEQRLWGDNHDVKKGMKSRFYFTANFSLWF